jgi:hypothetical protein
MVKECAYRLLHDPGGLARRARLKYRNGSEIISVGRHPGRQSVFRLPHAAVTARVHTPGLGFFAGGGANVRGYAPRSGAAPASAARTSAGASHAGRSGGGCTRRWRRLGPDLARRRSRTQFGRIEPERASRTDGGPPARWTSPLGPRSSPGERSPRVFVEPGGAYAPAPPTPRARVRPSRGRCTSRDGAPAADTIDFR